MSYKSEFGESFQLGFDLSQYPFLRDESWHNDDCPRFEWDQHVLWVNHHDCDEFERYGVFKCFINEDGDPEIDYDTVHIQTNEVSEIIAFLEGFKS